MALASRCQVIICCWVLANQKTLIVALVKKYQNLARGLQQSQHDQDCEHHVGVVDQERMQVVHANQFCFLRQLLLVHVCWCYMLVCKFLCYFI